MQLIVSKTQEVVVVMLVAWLPSFLVRPTPTTPDQAYHSHRLKKMKEKRKTRLDKGTSSEFIGFNAFQTMPTGPATFGTPSTASDRSSGVSWSPIYSGSDSAVQTAFSWLTSKRDSVTHVKALQTLTKYISQKDESKKLQILAVQHWVWLYHRKLYFDATPTVRAASIQLWVAIRERLPKAFGNLVEAGAAATASTDASVVLGMLYSAQTDPSTEVRQVANALPTKKVLFQDLYAEQAEGGIDWETGILSYVEYILSCGRHSVFYERLLQGKKSTQTSSFSDLNEGQNDAVLEAYTRVTANALDTLSLYLRHHPTGQLAYPAKTTTWFKTLPSSHAILRRYTYSLISTVASHCPGVDLPSLSQALSSEKEPANWPSLLECIVVVTKAGGGILSTDYVQPITKAWKKALYGANMASAGPMLLPLTAFMASPTQVWKLLQAAWEGRELTLGGTDRWREVQAISECLSFGLLRKQSDGQVLSQFHAEWVQLYGTIVREALSTDPSRLTGTTLVAHGDALKTLGQHLVRFEFSLSKYGDELQSPSNALEVLVQQSSLSTIASDLLPLLETETVKIIPLSSRSISSLLSSSEELLSVEETPFLSTFRAVFESLCPRESSGDVPSSDDYKAMEILMDQLECRRLFHSDNAFTMEKFLMNDLLRWAIIHTSKLAVGQSQNGALVKCDFVLLRKCLESITDLDRKQKLWQSFLREVLSAKCDLEWLAIGLKTLVGERGVSWIRCESLNNFVQTIDENVQRADHDDLSEFSGEQSEEDQHAVEFLALCCGISPTSSVSLVDASAVKALAADIINSEHEYGSRHSPVEEVLIKIVRTDRSDLLNEEEENGVLLHAWSRGSYGLIEGLLVCLQERNELSSRFIADASARLQSGLKDLKSLARESQRREGKVWGARASDLFRVCSARIDKDVETPPSLSLIGLSDFHLWTSEPGLAYELCMALFSHVPDHGERFALISSSSVSTANLMVSILVAISQATTELVEAEIVCNQNDRCSEFLRAIGAPELDGGLLELCIRDAIDKLKTLCKTEPDADGKICRHVAVISQLIGTLFHPIDFAVESELSAESINAGDELWYIPDPSKTNERVATRVVKAHFDAEAGYYFSIKVEKDGTTQERQTVISRLRKSSTDRVPRNAIDPKSLSQEEVSRRNSLRDLLLQAIVFPYFDALPWKTCIAEIINIVVSQLGLGEERGLGSLHYDLFKLLKNEIDSCKTSFTEKDWNSFDKSAWKISMACGFGVIVPPCKWITSILKLDPSPIFAVLSTNFTPVEIKRISIPSLAVIYTFLCSESTSGLILADDKLLAHLPVLMKRRLANSPSEFNGDVLLALKVLNELLSHSIDPADFGEALSGLVLDFASAWDASNSAVWSPYFQRTLELQKVNPGLVMILKETVVRISDNLTSCLYSSAKQWIAFQLFRCLSDRKAPLRDESSIALPASTEVHLKKWTKDRNQEESEECVQDVEVVSQWLPLSMMTEIEKWGDETFESVQEGGSIGKFLVWLIVLDIIDQAAPIDFQNRPAFVTYIRLTESQNVILNTSILFDPFVNKPKESKKALVQSYSLDSASDVEVEKLSSLVLFRTTEVLPSLCRQWWEEECPKVYVSPVQSLIESQIAPTILDRELRRLKSCKGTFGDMEVSGSVGSRQISAAYVQDDFKLKVLIQLPSSFPLRSAEVDCSKTLGVPQARWKRWSLQITQMLNNQGGTLHDALQLWKDNVDKEFEGIEPCPVCYSVLHVKTHKLPTLECSTCHNRFHADCLQQWFRSSGKSQCVLCQQDWRGTRVG